MFGSEIAFDAAARGSPRRGLIDCRGLRARVDYFANVPTRLDFIYERRTYRMVLAESL
jgi:hypothetical protein